MTIGKDSQISQAVVNSLSLRAWIWAGGGLGAIFATIAAISPGFAYGTDWLDRPTYLYVTLAMLAGVAVPWMIWAVPRTAGIRWRGLGLLIGLGLVFRLLMLPSTPVFEDDWYRYLWDGTVVAQGVSPYRFTPAEASPVGPFGQAVDPSDDPDLARLQALAKADRTNYQRINYPFVTTIYPPPVQVFFALAHHLAPHSLAAWRIVLLLVDTAGLGVLLAMLLAWNRSLLWGMVYWWNPLPILEGHNSGHMDLLIIPVIAGALLFIRNNRVITSIAFLAFASAIKIWPLLLAPLWAAPGRVKPKYIIAMAGFFLFVFGLMTSPQWLIGFDENSGIIAYSGDWQTNSFLFASLMELVNIFSADPGQMLRLVIALSLAGLALFFGWRQKNVAQLPRQALILVAALLFLSPTGYPWYGLWLLPFLLLSPNYGLAALAVFFPLYYLRYPFDALDLSAWHQWLVVPIAFGVPLLLTAIEHLVRRRHG